MGILSQHAPILTTSVELEKGVMSLMITLVLILVTVLPSKDINKGVMSRFSLPKYGCIHFYFSYIHMSLTWTFNRLAYASCTITQITLPHYYCSIMTQITLPYCYHTTHYLVTQACFPIYKTLFLRRRASSSFSYIFRLNTVALHKPLVWVLLVSCWT